MKYGGFLLIICFACGTRNDKSLNKEIVGEWRNVYLKVTQPTFRGRDSTRVTECDSANWERMLKIKPIRTTFYSGGLYKSEYYTLRDSLFRTAKGTWSASGDTLIMSQQEPSPSIYRFRTLINGSVATFDGVLDFDADGKADDHYEGKQRKQ